MTQPSEPEQDELHRKIREELLQAQVLALAMGDASLVAAIERVQGVAAAARRGAALPQAPKMDEPDGSRR